MFDGYTWSELGAIFAMQGFAGLILFSVFVLMALGLAIIFGQMGVINMAHGEFMILGAYVTYLCSTFFEAFLPGIFGIYFFIAMILAFIASGALGMAVEWGLIRHLYKRPLDTLLATWGLSLILQQIYRSTFGAREVGVTIPEWMLGSFQVTDLVETADQRALRDDPRTHDLHRGLCDAVPLVLGQAGPRGDAEPHRWRGRSESTQSGRTG